MKRPVVSPAVTPGIWKHYSGFNAFVIGVGVLHDTTWEFVAYTSSKAADEGRVLLRALSDFLAPVEWPDGVTRPRFVREGWG